MHANVTYRKAKIKYQAVSATLAIMRKGMGRKDVRKIDEKVDLS